MPAPFAHIPAVRTLYLLFAFFIAVPAQAQQFQPGDLATVPFQPAQQLAVADSSEALLALPERVPEAFALPGEAAEVSLLQPDQDRGRFLDWMHQDAEALIGGADLSTLGYAAGTFALLAPLSAWDDDIGPMVKEQAGGSTNGFLEVVNELGGPRAIALPASAFAISLATDNERFQNAAFTSLQSLLYAGAISYALKYTVGRARPHELEGTHTFDPFSGNASFPSGHTTTAFAIVTPWVMFYPHPITYGLFALSTGTAVARIARDAHWATDVLAGAALGFATGYWLSRQHGAFSDNVRVTPILAPGNVGLGVKATF